MITDPKINVSLISITASLEDVLRYPDWKKKMVLYGTGISTYQSPCNVQIL